MRFQTPFTKAFTKATLGLLMSAAVITSCKKDDPIIDDDDDTPIVTDKPVKEVSGILSGEVKFSADTIYLLKGFVRVGDDDGSAIKSTGTLTIEPGTLILGDRETKGTLVVQRGSRILAEGSAEKPIVFTSERPIGLRQPGDWGGVVLCGKAKNNIPGGTAQLEGGYGAYHGGGDDNDNSGILKYVRIEYAGIAINPNEEVNSLTMGSVGRGTQISYVQASYGLDDSFEWFGGTVNCSHLIAYRGLDDDLDVDLGYSGNVQFALSIRDNQLSDQSGSNGFEVDNDGTGTGNTPFTSGTFSNITVIGPKGNRETPIGQNFQHALHLRRNSKIKIHNSFFTGYPWGIYIDGTSTEANAKNNELVLKNNVLAAVENWGGNGFGNTGKLYVNDIVGYFKDANGVVDPTTGAAHGGAQPKGIPYRVIATGSTWSSAELEAWFLANNQFLPKWQDAGIDGSIFDVANPKVTPNAGSMLLSGASFDGLSGFQNVAFRGAFGTENWTQGWSEFNPNAKDYTK